jgi:dihydropteroate synthase
MQLDPRYEDVVGEVTRFFEDRLREVVRHGIGVERLVLDPGIGFGKTLTHNLQLLAHLEAFQRLGRPVCLGVSRKGFLGRLLGRPVEQRLAGSLATVCHALGRRAVHMVRVHDVRETKDAVTLFTAIDSV